MRNKSFRRLLALVLEIIFGIVLANLFSYPIMFAFFGGQLALAVIYSLVLDDADGRALAEVKNLDTVGIIAVAGGIVVLLIMLSDGLWQPLNRFFSEISSSFAPWFFPVLIGGIVVLIVLSIIWKRRR